MKKVGFLLLACVALVVSSCGWKGAQENLEDAGEAIADAADSVAGAVAEGAENVADAFKADYPELGLYSGVFTIGDEEIECKLWMLEGEKAKIEATRPGASEPMIEHFTVEKKATGILEFTSEEGSDEITRFFSTKDDEGPMLIRLPEGVTEIPSEMPTKNILRLQK